MANEVLTQSLACDHCSPSSLIVLYSAVWDTQETVQNRQLAVYMYLHFPAKSRKIFPAYWTPFPAFPAYWTPFPAFPAYWTPFPREFQLLVASQLSNSAR